MDMNNHPHEYAHNGKFMLGSAILLFLIFFIILLLQTFADICFRRPDFHRRHRPTPRLLPNLSAAAAAASRKGLDLSLFKFLPTFTYSSATHSSLPECAVCLSEFEDDDEGRVLPNCSHGFHTHCIDTWFRSHSSCPICRAPVEPKKIWLRRTEVCVSEAELGGCSNLPPPIGCPRKGFDFGVVSVIIEGSGLRSSESGRPEESRDKSSDEQALRLKTIWR